VTRLKMFAVAALVLGLAAGSSLPVGAGAIPQPDWTNSPTQGPSPNPDHEVAGDGCFIRIGVIESGGLTVLGGEQGGPVGIPGVVTVTLHDPDTDVILADEQYPADETGGDWGGDFPIPAGLDPDTYPLRAECDFPSAPASAGGAPLILGGLDFDYEERSYTVIGQRQPGDPVDVEPTFTG